MRHYKKGRKLGTDSSHTKAIKKSLCVALFKNDRIKTTLERAKEIRGDVDRIVTLAKRGDIHARRQAIARLGDKDLVAEIFAKVEQGMFKDRPGGYSRILKIGTRRGDAAVIVIMELVYEPVRKKSAEKPAPAGKSSAKATDKKANAKKSSDNKADPQEAQADEGIIDVEPVEEASAKDTADEKSDKPQEGSEDKAADEKASEASDEKAADANKAGEAEAPKASDEKAAKEADSKPASDEAAEDSTKKPE